jgi:hypothetical protein
MTVKNFDGPYVLRTVYTVEPLNEAALTHIMDMNVEIDGTPEPGTAFADITITGRPTGSMALNTFADAWRNVVEDLMDADTTTILRMELYYVTPNSDQLNWIAQYDINQPGTGGAVPKPAVQLTFTFRSKEGGLMRCQLMEGIYSRGTQLGYAELNQGGQDLVDFVLDYNGSTWFLAKDTSPPVGFYVASPAENDALWNKRYRP